MYISFVKMRFGYGTHLAQILTIYFYLICQIDCNDILGCGGFIKSHADIDFSRVEIKLWVNLYRFLMFSFSKKSTNGRMKKKISFTHSYMYLHIYAAYHYVIIQLIPIYRLIRFGMHMWYYYITIDTRASCHISTLKSVKGCFAESRIIVLLIFKMAWDCILYACMMLTCFS